MEKILLIFLKLNFTLNILGCDGLNSSEYFFFVVLQAFLKSVFFLLFWKWRPDVCSCVLAKRYAIHFFFCKIGIFCKKKTKKTVAFFESPPPFRKRLSIVSLFFLTKKRNKNNKTSLFFPQKQRWDIRFIFKDSKKIISLNEKICRILLKATSSFNLVLISSYNRVIFFLRPKCSNLCKENIRTFDVSVRAALELTACSARSKRR